MATPAVSQVRREVFLASPGKGTAVMAYAFHLNHSGSRQLCIEQRWSRSDTIDVAYRRISGDYGQTWSAPVEYITGEKRSDGMLRRHPRGVWVDPESGRAVELWLEAILPGDNPLEGLNRWQIHYAVDGGPDRTMDQKLLMLGDQTCRPIRLGRRMLLPVSRQPLTEDGKLYNPGGGYTWHDSGVLLLEWRGRELASRLGGMILGDPTVSTRGFVEPTLSRLRGDRVLMVMRGSNDARPELPGYKWFSVSADGGETWSKTAPWAFITGENFFSPSACSQLLEHSSGRLFWIGNILSSNPRGNRPRYPMNLAEVDRSSGLLLPGSVREIDGLHPGDDPQMTLSNFYAREDRRSGEILVHMTRLFALPDGWEGDAMLYRVQISGG